MPVSADTNFSATFAIMWLDALLLKLIQAVFFADQLKNTYLSMEVVIACPAIQEKLECAHNSAETEKCLRMLAMMET